eukprot:36467_1
MASKDLYNVKMDFEQCRAHFIDLYAKFNKHQDDIKGLLKGSQDGIDEKLIKMRDEMDEILSSTNDAVLSVNNCRAGIAKLTKFEEADRANITKLDKSVSLLETQQESRSGVVSTMCFLADCGSHIVPFFGPAANTAIQDLIFARVTEMQSKNAAYVNYFRSHDGKKIVVTSPNIKTDDDSDVGITYVDKNGKRHSKIIPHNSLQFQLRFKDDNPDNNNEKQWRMVISLEHAALSKVPELTCSVPLYDFKQWKKLGLSSTTNNIVWTSQENLTAGCSVTDKVDVKKTKYSFPVKQRNKPVQYVFYE